MRRMRASKKGFELQFNWIFVLVAGGVFLGFFFLVIKNQLGSAAVEKSVGQQSDLGFLLRASQGSRSTEKLVYLPGSFIFSCEDGVSNYYSEGSTYIEQYNYLAVFSPQKIDAKDLILKTESLKAPFAAMPIVYLANREIEYLFMSDGLQLTRLFYGLPENVTRSVITVPISSYPDRNFDSLIIVADEDSSSMVLGQTLSSFVPRRYGAVSLVVVLPEGGVAGNYGRLRFYEYTSSGFSLTGESYYFTQEQLLGAVYSGRKDLYSCQFDKTIDRLSVIAKLHSRRAAALQTVYATNAQCNLKYSSIIVDLEEIASVAALPLTTYDDTRRLFEASSRVARLNTELVEQTSCPPIY